MKVKEININTEDGVLHAFRWKGTKKKVIFIQGIAGNKRSLSGLAEILNEKKFEVYTYDLRGRGESLRDTKKRYNLHQHIEDLWQLMNQLSIKRAVLIGHSYGAQIAMRFYERYPERVRGLVILDGGIVKDLRKLIPMRSMLRKIVMLHDRQYRKPIDYYNEMQKAGMGLPPFHEIEDYLVTELEETGQGYRTRLKRIVLDKELGDLGMSTSLTGWFKLLANPVRYFFRTRKRLRYAYEAIRVPVLIVKTANATGKNKIEFLPMNTLSEMTVRIPRVESVIIDSNHFQMLFDRNDLMIRAMTRYLNNVP